MVEADISVCSPHEMVVDYMSLNSCDEDGAEKAGGALQRRRTLACRSMMRNAPSRRGQARSSLSMFAHV